MKLCSYATEGFYGDQKNVIIIIVIISVRHPDTLVIYDLPQCQDITNHTPNVYLVIIHRVF